MKNFKQIARITLQRNYFWIIMLFLGTLLLQNFVATNDISKMSDKIFRNAAVVMYLYDNEPIKKESSNYSEDPNAFFGNGDKDMDLYAEMQPKIEKYSEELKEKYKTKALPTDFFIILNGKFQAILNKYGVTREEFSTYSADEGKMPYATYDYLYKYYEYSQRELSENKNYMGMKFDISKRVFMADFGLYIFAVFMAFLLTSMEHLTSFYDFTRMYPWSNERSYINKLIFGLLFILGLYILSIFLKIGIWKSSILKNLIVFDFKNAIEILVLLGIYLIGMGVGAISGNFLGHFGMLIIALSGLTLYTLNCEMMQTIFINGNHLIHINLFKADIYLRTLATPINAFIGNTLFHYDFNQRLMVFVLGLIYTVLGIYWTNTAKAERSGMLILKKNFSNYVKILAILTTTNLFSMIVHDLLLNNSRILMFLLYALILFIAYKFYDLLFKIKIKI